MRARTLSLVAATLAISVGLFWACGGGGGGGGKGRNQGPIPCGGIIPANLLQAAGSPIDLTDPRAVRHFQITGLAATLGPITIESTNINGDVSLYLAVPGTPLGEMNLAAYYVSSSDTGTTERLRIDDSGVTDVLGNLDATYTLADFEASGAAPVFLAVCTSSPADFNVQVTCVPAPTTTTPIACWGQASGTVAGSFSMNLPDFTDLTETDFYELPTLAATTTEVIIDLSITSGDAHLSLAAPGTPPGSLDPTEYVFCSCQSGNDRLILDLAGITDFGGGLASGLTLTDYLSAGYPISFLVMGFSPSTNYDLQVTCVDPASPPPPASTVPISCGGKTSGTVPGSLSPTLPMFLDLAETIFYEMTPTAPSVTEVVIDLLPTSGEAHLFLAAPGATPGSLDRADYIFASSTTGDDQITIDAAGLEDIGGTRVTTFTISDYLSAGAPITFLVTGYDPTTDYDLSVNCCNPNSPIVQDAACGTTLTGITIEGLSIGPVDLTNCRRNHFYRVTNVPGGVEYVTVLVSSTLTGGDTNVHFLDVGIPPGSTNLADYVFNSIPGPPFASLEEDAITVMGAGIATWFKSANTPTLTQYLNSGVDMGFVVNGRTTQAIYSLTVFCDSAPIQIPTLISCGGTASGTLTGKLLSPPDYTDPNEVIFFEIDGTTLPPGVTSVDIGVATNTGDCDLYLAAPGITPGIPAMIIESVQSMTTADGFVIDATGITGYPGPQGRSTTDWNLTDYLNSGTNISFAVQSWEISSDYLLTVTCN